MLDLPDELTDKILEVKHIFLTVCEPMECFTLFTAISKRINEHKTPVDSCFLKNYKKKFDFLGFKPNIIVEINKSVIEMPAYIHSQIKQTSGSPFGLNYSWVIIRYHKESQDGPVIELLRSQTLPFAIRSLADDIWRNPKVISPFLLNRVETYSIKEEGVVKIDRVRPWFKNLWERADIDYDTRHADFFDAEPF